MKVRIEWYGQDHTGQFDVYLGEEIKNLSYKEYIEYKSYDITHNTYLWAYVVPILI